MIREGLESQAHTVVADPNQRRTDREKRKGLQRKLGAFLRANKIQATRVQTPPRYPANRLGTSCWPATLPRRLRRPTGSLFRSGAVLGAASATNPQKATHEESRTPTSRSPGRPGYRGKASWADDSRCGGYCDRAGLLPVRPKRRQIGIWGKSFRHLRSSIKRISQKGNRGGVQCNQYLRRFQQKHVSYGTIVISIFGIRKTNLMPSIFASGCQKARLGPICAAAGVVLPPASAREMQRFSSFGSENAGRDWRVKQTVA